MSRRVYFIYEISLHTRGKKYENEKKIIKVKKTICLCVASKNSEFEAVDGFIYIFTQESMSESEGKKNPLRGRNINELVNKEAFSSVLRIWNSAKSAFSYCSKARAASLKII